VRTVVELGSGRFIVNAGIRSRDAFGYAFHLLDDDRIVRPVGRAEALDGAVRPAPFALVRPIAPGNGGTFWAATFTDYVLTQYDHAGRPLRRLTADREWFTTADPSTPEGVFNPKIQDLVFDPQTGLLWILAQVRDPLFHERIVRGREAMPGVYEWLSRTGSMVDLYDTIIEVIDPTRGEIMATLRLDGYASTFVVPWRVAIYQERPTGEGDLRIHRMSLVRQSSRR
jgi:hypothetical protein